MTHHTKTRPLDTRTFVALGEGLAAGLDHFSLSRKVQQGSFPALVASRLGTSFEQPLFQPPGLGNVIGQGELPVIVPDLLQTTVRDGFPPAGATLSNLSIPGLTLAEALDLRPEPPLVRRDDAKLTLVNFILGLPALLDGDSRPPTQVEYAHRRKPTLALVALGYHEVLEAAVAGDATLLPDRQVFGRNYRRLLEQLEGASILATTIPDPVDTAYFSTLETAARILRTEAGFLVRQFALAEDDLLALPGLFAAGYQLTERRITGELPPASVLPAAEAARLTQGVRELNRQITSVADERRALLYDLHGFLAGVARHGSAIAAGVSVDATYLGGFYLLNGFYPGRTGHALIANDLLELLNRELGAEAAPVDVAAVAAADANTASRLAPGPTFTDEYLVPRTPAELPPPPEIAPEHLRIWPIQTTYPEMDPSGRKRDCKPLAGVPAGGLSEPELERSLELPEGLEQTLPLNPERSYFGDALRPVDCPDDEPFLPGFPAFGSCADTLFGGLAMTDSRLVGQVHIKFSQPDENNVSRFEVTHPGGLVGEDGQLAAPRLFRLPTQLNMVSDVPGLVSSGKLDLNTGIVTDLHYNVLFLNTAILCLFGVNPGLPAVPMLFPGPPNAGSSWARFEQREDGLLDFTFAGHLFLPLGLEAGDEPIRFPLPFANPMLQCASILARGTSLHPHLSLSTRESAEPATDAPEVPENTVRELTAISHNSSFGDVFGLNMEELGGTATGRCHLLGRLRVQFGPRFGNSVPVSVAFLPPGGLLGSHPRPLPFLPPGTSRGLIGFDEVLEFPKASYAQRGLACADDPLNLAVGAIHLPTGEVTGELLKRGFVLQELFVKLLQVEPCTPADSFLYQGPAAVERGAGDSLVLRFDGQTLLPYPAGLKFPAPEGNGAFVALEGSRLDPFLRLQAVEGDDRPRRVMSGAESVTSSTGQRFSYRYEFPVDSGAATSFEYTNHEQGGTFRLAVLSWIDFGNSRGSAAGPGEYDTVTFAGFGSWSLDEEPRLRQVSAQISSAGGGYVGIQIDGGSISNVNTKPTDIEETYP